MSAGGWAVVGGSALFLLISVVLAVVGLAIVLRGLLDEIRDQRIPGQHADADLAVLAQVDLDRLCHRLGIARVRVFIVPVLGRPIRGSAHGLGTGGFALTRFRPRQRPVILVATAAAALSPAARQDLLAHELAHVVRRASTRGAMASCAPMISAVLAAAGAIVLAVTTSTTMAGAAGAAAGILLLLGWMWMSRSEEQAADLHAYDITGDVDGVAELMDAYPKPTGSGLGRLLGRAFASHPEPAERLLAVQIRARSIPSSAEGRP